MDQEDRRRGQAKLDAAYDDLEDKAPDRLARAIRWLREPKGRWVRLPLGLLIIAVSFLGPVVPVVGIEFIPIGLLLVAQDVPPLREPVADLTFWLERKWVELRTKWRRRRHRHV